MIMITLITVWFLITIPIRINELKDSYSFSEDFGNYLIFILMFGWLF